MGVAQKPRSWPRWVNFTPALVGHFYIGGDNQQHEESALQAEIRRLKAELRQVTEERNILKEAAAYFASESRKGTRS